MAPGPCAGPSGQKPLSPSSGLSLCLPSHAGSSNRCLDSRVPARLFLGSKTGSEIICGLLWGLWVSGKGRTEQKPLPSGFPTTHRVLLVCEIEV